MFESLGRWVWGAWWVVTTGVGVALLTHETRFVMALPAACLDPTWRPVCARAFVDATVDMMMISHALL